MSVRWLRVVVMIAFCASGGCAGPRLTPTPPARIETPAAEPPSGPSGAATEVPAPETGRDRAAVDAAGDTSPPELVSAYAAVHALVAQADTLAARGDRALAAAAVERALHIEPANAWLWYRLAQLHLARGDLDQAAAAIERSDSLQRGTTPLRQANRALAARISRLRPVAK